MGLHEYNRKRDFDRTSEPRGKRAAARKGAYVIQKHAASRLHYDFRLEHDGVLLSWAVPKGPSLDPADKRLAVRVEDHPVDYGDFEGTIPKGEYGGGSVLLWDRGTWTPEGSVDEGLRKGKLEFTLHGKKLGGGWKLIRLRDRTGGGDDKNWLLIKRSDATARRGDRSITEERPESVLTGKGIEEIGTGSRNSKKTSRSRASGNASKRAPAAGKAAAARKKAPARARATARTIRAAKPRASSFVARVSRLSGARRADLSGFVPVQLATLVEAAPEGEGWIHEVKYDGYRMLAELDAGKVRWFSRNGLDWTTRFERLSPAVAELPARRALLDGEVVVLDEDGVSHFQRLQQALNGESSEPLTYYVFDLLHSDGYDLRRCPLIERKRVLADLLSSASPDASVRFSEHFETSGAVLLGAACAHKLEGVVSKRRDGAYLAGRSREWMKTRCDLRQEFVVVGFTEPHGSRVGIGALALAVNEKKGLRFAGRVGTGFGTKVLAALRKRLEPARTGEIPVLQPLSADNRRGVTWVEPRMVIEVAFTGWTSDGLLRHPRFIGMREDKHVKDVVREKASSSKRKTVARAKTKRKAAAAVTSRRKAPALDSDEGPAADGSVAGVRISHPERVVDAESGLTKLDVARYYENAAELLLPHVANRPLSVMRCPNGFADACFFQKHGGTMFAQAVKSISLRDSQGKSQYLMVDSLEGLLSLVQMNVVELHPWGSRADQLEKPDRIFFDLDPAPDVPWKRVVEAALQVRDVLTGIDLESFVKTTGGKGLHVVIPIARRYAWDRVKAFSRAIAFELARAQPKQYVAVAAKDARRGRIFVDYLRNSRGATAVAPYSVRARPNATLSVPIAWKKLETLEGGGHFHLEAGVPWKKPAGRDPWADFFASAQTLPRGATSP